jgi:hypothetical protein
MTKYRMDMFILQDPLIICPLCYSWFLTAPDMLVHQDPVTFCALCSSTFGSLLGQNNRAH